LYNGNTNNTKPRSNSNVNDDNEDTKTNDKHSLLSHAVPRSNSIIHQNIEMTGIIIISLLINIKILLLLLLIIINIIIIKNNNNNNISL